MSPPWPPPRLSWWPSRPSRSAGGKGSFRLVEKPERGTTANLARKKEPPKTLKTGSSGRKMRGRNIRSNPHLPAIHLPANVLELPALGVIRTGQSQPQTTAKPNIVNAPGLTPRLRSAAGRAPARPTSTRHRAKAGGPSRSHRKRTLVGSQPTSSSCAGAVPG